MSTSGGPIRELAERYAIQQGVPPGKREDFVKCVYSAIAAISQSGVVDVEYIQLALETCAHLYKSTTPATSRPKQQKRSISGWVIFLLILVSIGGGIFALWQDTALIPEIQSKPVRFLFGALFGLVIVLFYVSPRGLLEFAIFLLGSIWVALGRLRRVLLPISVFIGFVGTVSVLMAWVHLPVSLLVASVISITVGAVSGSLFITTAKATKNGWWLFVLGAFCTVASSTWTFLNFAVDLRWDWITIDVVIASIFALRIALE